MLKRKQKGSGGISKEDRRKWLQQQYNQDGERKGNWYLKGTAAMKALGVGSFKSEVGENYLAFVPQPSSPAFFKQIAVHYDVGGTRNSYLCPRDMYEKHCPVCDYADKLRKQGEPQEVYKQFYPSTRFLFFIINVKSGETRRLGILVYDAPRSIYYGMKDMSTIPGKKGFVDLYDPEAGWVFYFMRTGTTQRNTEYKGYRLLKRKSPLDIGEAPGFEEVLVPPDVKAMEADLAGSNSLAEGDAEYDKWGDDEGEEQPSRGKKKRKASPPLEEEDEDEDEEDSEEDDELDEEFDELDDEDEEGEYDDDEEEEEVVSPPRSRKAKAGKKRRTVTTDEDDDLPFERRSKRLRESKDAVRSTIRKRSKAR